MDSERILESQTVLIQGETIFKFGASSDVTIPESAQIIDGDGKFLIPGLIDMHVHLTEKDLPLYIANGITTVRNVNGDTSHLKLRSMTATSTIVGPRIFTSGPLLSGPKIPWKIKAVPTSPNEARQMVAKQKQMGFDFIKIYDGLSMETYLATMDEARKQGIPAIGHIPELVGFKEVLNQKQASLEHVEKIVQFYFDFKYEEQKIPDVAQMILDANSWVCPTIAVHEIFKLNATGNFLPMLDNPEMAFVSPGIMAWWKGFARPARSDHGSDHQFDSGAFYDFQLKLTKGLFDAGVPLLAGTDAPNPGMVHGFALHEELRNLVLSGLSPYESLKIATGNGAKFLGLEDEIGKVEVGTMADLVLLSDNPLVNIENTKNIEGVMVRGKWYSRNQLDQLLEDVKVNKR